MARLDARAQCRRDAGQLTRLAQLRCRAFGFLPVEQTLQRLTNHPPSQGPITEELVFRSFVIPLHLLAKMPPSKIVFITPLYFGIAHIHHFYEYTLTHPHTPLLPALARSLFQFTYTSLFGFYAVFLFLRTANIPAVILAHSFCNFMGLPRLWGRVEAPVAMGPPDVAKKEDPESPLHANGAARMQVAHGRLNIVWTLAYYLLLVLGAVGFSYYIWILTDSSNALVGFGRVV